MAYNNQYAIRKYRKIQASYREQYKKGLRYDVCVEKLSDLFDLSKNRISQILRMELPAETETKPV